MRLGALQTPADVALKVLQRWQLSVRQVVGVLWSRRSL